MVTAEAYAACLRLARRHYENFPVASRLVPGAMRPHIAAIYAFARTADDFADEGARSDSERLALLDDWRARLHTAAAGKPAAGDSDAGAIFVALADTIDRCRLDVQLFDDLLSAFRQDVVRHRYETWDDLLDYCRRSANPVGRLVLGVAGHTESTLHAPSDAMCTALQLVNFWQDLERDWLKGRVYVPASLLRACGANEIDLDRKHLTPAWRDALSSAAHETRMLFRAGWPIADAVQGRLRYELRATWLGGSRILDRLERRGFDVFRSRPSLGWRDLAPIAWRVVAWTAPRPLAA